MKAKLSLETSRHPQNNLKHYATQGQRRIAASEPQQQQQYIDYRNLWKASTPNQQKQYEAIRESDIMSEQRKITFLKFNYRHSEDKNLTYNQVYNRMFEINKNRRKNMQEKYEDQVNNHGKKFKIKNESFIPFTKQIIRRTNDGSLQKDKIFDVCFQTQEIEHREKSHLMKKFSFGSRVASTHFTKRKSFLKQFQSTNNLRNLIGTSSEDNWFDRFCQQKNIEESSHLDKDSEVVPGSMNVCDLWGERQLKQNLGFLPCTRDRPKLLKMYSQKLQAQRNRMKKKDSGRCATEM